MTPTTYENQRQRCADHLYHERGGYYMLVEANLDLFGYAVPGCGYYDVRSLDYAEELTIRLDKWQAFRHMYHVDTVP